MIEEILEKVGVTPRHWRYMLAGERNASVKLGDVIQTELGIPKETFIFGSVKKRRTEWNKVLRRYELEMKNNPPKNPKCRKKRSRK